MRTGKITAATPDCTICGNNPENIPPERLALWERWKMWRGRDVLLLRAEAAATTERILRTAG